MRFFTEKDRDLYPRNRKIQRLQDRAKVFVDA